MDKKFEDKQKDHIINTLLALGLDDEAILASLRKLKKMQTGLGMSAQLPTNVKYRGGVENLCENLSLQQIRSKDIYSRNNHVNKFYNARKSLIGNPNTNVKLITSQLNDDGSADFLFQTVATPYDVENYEYKELDSAPIATSVNQGELVNNTTKEYIMCLRINDFWELIDVLEVVENNEFDKDTLSAILDLSEDVKFSCSCPSFVYTGISYYATLDDASLIPNTIVPKVWDKYRANALCCKHLSGLFRTLSFQIPKMAMSIKKNMKDTGLLD